MVTGGFGSGVLELLEEARLTDPAYRDVALRIVGIPGDRFVDHGSVADLRRVLRLDAAGPGGPGPRDAGRAPGDARPVGGRRRLIRRRRLRPSGPPVAIVDRVSPGEAGCATIDG